MKKIKLLFLLFPILIFFSCDKKDDPTSPENEDPPSETLAETTIGSSGGELATDNFVLTVPAGAFSSNIDLKLYEETTNPLGSNVVSKVYKLDGLPDNYSQPLQIKIAYSGSLSGENAIAVGEEQLNSYSGENEIIFDFFDASSNDGFLSAQIEIPVTSDSPNMINNNPSELSRIILAVSNGNQTSTNHFIYNGFSNNLSSLDLIKLQDFFEELYTKYENDGFDYTRTNWPTEIILVDHSEYKVNVYRYNYGTARLILKLKIPPGFSFIQNKDLIESSYAFFVTCLYDSELISLSYLDNSFGSWIVIGWESYSYYSLLMEPAIANLMSGLSQMQSVFGNNLPLTILMKFITDNYGNEIWSDIYNENGGDATPSEIIKSIITNTASPWEWLPEFHNYLVQNEGIKDIIGEDWWTSNPEDVLTIGNINKSETVVDSYYDLSCKWYEIVLAQDIPEDADLDIEAYSNDVAEPVLSLYQTSGGTLEFLGKFDGAVGIENIKTYADAGYDIVVFVTNGNAEFPYTNQADISLAVELVTEEIPSPFVSGYSITEGIMGEVQTISYNFGEPDTTYSQKSVTYHTPQPYIEGSGDTTSFSTSWDYYKDEFTRYIGYMSVNLNDTRNLITDFSVSAKEIYTYTLSDSSAETKHLEFSGTGLPLSQVTGTIWNFVGSGQDISSYINSYSYEYEFKYKDGTIGRKETLIPGDLTMSNNSRLIIELRIE